MYESVAINTYLGDKFRGRLGVPELVPPAGHIYILGLFAQARRLTARAAVQIRNAQTWQIRAVLRVHPSGNRCARYLDARPVWLHRSPISRLQRGRRRVFKGARSESGRGHRQR
eukprot:SAG31_NODE_5556_length_2459_cov_1.666525_1_plen_114_part_00